RADARRVRTGGGVIGRTRSCGRRRRRVRTGGGVILGASAEIFRVWTHRPRLGTAWGRGVHGEGRSGVGIPREVREGEPHGCRSQPCGEVGSECEPPVHDTRNASERHWCNTPYGGTVVHEHHILWSGRCGAHWPDSRQTADEGRGFP